MLARIWLGFDSTYEGLKLPPDCARNRAVESFDSTYEGLKRRRLPAACAGMGSFDSTYEGLKLGSAYAAALSAWRVSTVPMRA